MAGEKCHTQPVLSEVTHTSPLDESTATRLGSEIGRAPSGTPSRE
jgi:hypothetical protein